MVRITFLVLWILSGRFQVLSQVSIQDSLALVSLYHATGGAQWTNHDHWLDGPVGTWHGVTLLDDRVYVLNLFDNGLTGHIPEAIGQLNGLIELDLSRANFTGNIPDVFGQMTDLFQISLRNCGLTGAIPPSLGNCLKLQRINLERNQLTGTIPPALASCTKMKQMLLRENQLSGLFPSVIESWPDLEQLDLGQNNFSGELPLWIESLDKLYWLFLDQNPFEGVMPFLGSKPNLTHLMLGPSEVTGELGSVLGQYPELAYLTIAGTNLSGELSPTHFNPEKIVWLEVYDNHIQDLGDFTSWAAYPNFNRLFVFGNNLDIDDLLPNSTLPSNKYFYSPQRTLGQDTTLALLPGASLTLQSPMQAPGIEYTWYFNFDVIPGQTGPVYVIEDFDPTDAGSYFFIANHPDLPVLDLLSATLTLEEESTAIDNVPQNKLMIAPNPATDVLSIFTDHFSSGYQLSVFSASGEELFNQFCRENQVQLSLASFPTGVLYLKWESEGQVGIQRVVKL